MGWSLGCWIYAGIISISGYLCKHCLYLECFLEVTVLNSTFLPQLASPVSLYLGQLEHWEKQGVSAWWVEPLAKKSGVSSEFLQALKGSRKQFFSSMESWADENESRRHLLLRPVSQWLVKQMFALCYSLDFGITIYFSQIGLRESLPSPLTTMVLNLC